MQIFARIQIDVNKLAGEQGQYEKKITQTKAAIELREGIERKNHLRKYGVFQTVIA